MWPFVHLVKSVVEISLGKINGPWVFPVPGNLDFINNDIFLDSNYCQLMVQKGQWDTLTTT